MPPGERRLVISATKEISSFGRLCRWIAGHGRAVSYVITVVLPVILRTGKRPVIFSRFAGLGDIICSIPAALELKKRHPGATFIYNCDVHSACLPKMGGVTSLTTSCADIGLVGYWYRGLLGGFYSFRSDDDDLTRDDTENSVVAFGKNCGVAVSDRHPTLAVDDSSRGSALGVAAEFQFGSSPFIVLHTGPSSKVRQWPRDSWIALVKALQAHGFKNIIQLGARAGSYKDADPIEVQPLPGVRSVQGQLTLSQSIALISLAKLYIGIDSGLLHAAASLRMPSIGLWGPTSAHFRLSAEERRLSVTSPVDCQGCHHRIPRLHWETGCPYDIKCMKELSVDSVVEAALAVLGTPAPKESAS